MRIETISWDLVAWDDYLYWQEKDKRNLKRINQLIKDIYRNPFDGLGKPEPLIRKSEQVLESTNR